MSGVFEKLRAALKAPAATSADLHKAIAAAADLADAAVADRARLSDQRADMLVASDSERTRWKAALAEADERQADAGAFAVALTQRLSAVEQAEDQARRAEVYARAKAQAAAAAKTIQRDYQQHAAKVLGVLRTLAEAQLAVDAANAMLPVGAAPIDDVELTARGRPAQPRRDLRSSTIELWCFAGTWDPVSAEAQDRAVKKKDARGYLNPAPPHLVGKAVGASNAEIDRRKFKRIEYLPASEWRVPPSLFALNLPGVFTPAISSPFGTDLTAVVAAIDAALVPKVDLAEQQPQVELIPILEEPPPEAPKAQLVDNGRSHLAMQSRSAARGGRR